MPFYASLGTLGRLVQAAAAITQLEVNSHGPASQAAVPLLILASYLGVLTQQEAEAGARHGCADGCSAEEFEDPSARYTCGIF
jgi:hypothetical protein